jgi:hypothetical protein
MSKRERVNSQLCVTVPTFLIIGLRLLVEEENAKRSKRDELITVSQAVESVLMSALGHEKRSVFQRLATKSPQFKRAAEAWMRQQLARRRPAKTQRGR